MNLSRVLQADFDVTFKGCWVQETDFGLIRHCPQIPESVVLNSATIFDPDADFSSCLRFVEDFFSRLHLPAIVVTAWRDWEKDLLWPALIAAGFEVESSPCWWLRKELTPAQVSTNGVRRLNEVPSTMDLAYVQFEGSLRMPNLYRLKMTSSQNKVHYLEESADFVGVSCHRRVGEAALIEDVYVIPPKRRQGRGRALLEAALNDALGEGLKEAFVHTSSEPMRRLCESAGFQQCSGAPLFQWTARKPLDGSAVR